MADRIFAGPWVGEFGWELFGWQGYLRALAQAERCESFIVCGRPGHEGLYSDFATQYIPYEVKGVKTDCWMCKDWKDDGKYRRYIQAGSTHVRPGHIHGHRKFRPGLKQKFIMFGKPDPRRHFDVLYHARSTTKFGTGYRNWPASKWAKLFKQFKGKAIAAIGSRSGAICIPGTTDLRGMPLGELFDYLASGFVLLGPSSGPMHLGSLCGIPHVAWSDGRKWTYRNKDRYEKIWNPHKTPVIFIEHPQWDPAVEAVLSAAERVARN